MSNNLITIDDSIHRIIDEAVKMVLSIDSSRSRSRSRFQLTSSFFLTSILSVFGFFFGQFYGYHAGLVDHNQYCGEQQQQPQQQQNVLQSPQKSISMTDEEIQRRVNEIFEQKMKEYEEEEEEQVEGDFPNFLKFDKKTSKFAVGMARVDRRELAQTLDYGNTNDGDGEALIIYDNTNGLPDDYEKVAKRGNEIPKFDVEEGLRNCAAVNVISIDRQNRKCLAIVGQYESYYMTKLFRVDPKNGGPIKSQYDLMPVSRAYANNGRQNILPPDKWDLKHHFNMLKTYLHNLDAVTAELEPLVKKIAKNNSIIVLTCNFGQSELLINFVCSARARGFDLSNVLVFATDEDTKELAKSIGVHAFYDKYNMENMPNQAAQHYGDKVFSKMMLAKTYCVQLINMLGYDLLFQDVDIVWYKDPLEYFHDPANDGFDMYFQDDGAYQLRYAPLSANSGFYFVRANDRTRYLFTSLLYSGDVILKSKSHQQVLIQRMNEHISLFNLRVKVISREKDDFPGGFHYHRRRDFMKDIIQGKNKNPYIFHMSWTLNKENKLKYLQQMGEWFVNEKCIGVKKQDILSLDNDNPEDTAADGGDEPLAVANRCCLAEPKIQCHYRDKPSKIPLCKKSPPIDKNGASFW